MDGSSEPSLVVRDYFAKLWSKHMLHKILVATTSSESNHHVFEQALMLAKAMGAHLGLLHVTDPDETDEDRPSYLDSLEPYLREDDLDLYCYVGHFETFEPDLFGALVSKATAEGVSTDCIHCFGDPERAISDFAETWNADLVVVGRRGRSGMAEFFLGSVSNYTLHHAPCSVHIVHNPSPAHLKTSVEHGIAAST
jgi:nucleotide-binding universal stress UspA family protein